MEKNEEQAAPQLWEGDLGQLDYFSRKALLQLVRGPLLSEEGNQAEWQALVSNTNLFRAYLAELFLDLVVDHQAGIAFVRNACSAETPLPRAVKTSPLTLVDTVMLLHLRRELLVDTSSRVIIGRDELLEQLDNYRPVAKLDEAAFRKRLKSAWSKFVKAGILQPLDSEERCEISPVLKLLFGADEVRALSSEYELLLEQGEDNLPTGLVNRDDDDDPQEPRDDDEQRESGDDE